MDKYDIEKILDKYANAKSIRSQMDGLFYEAARMCDPNQMGVFSSASQPSTAGQTNTDHLFSTIQCEAALRMASGIFSYLMPVGNRWFEFTPQDYKLSENDSIKRWLSIAADVLHDEIWRSNFQREMFATIQSLCIFGNGTISVDKTEDGGLSFKSYHIGNIWFDVNNKGNIDTVYRRLYWTARQVVQEFGDDTPKEIQEYAADKNKCSERIEFLHCVYPRQDYDPDKLDKKGKKYVSQYIWVEKKRLVKDSGFTELPYLVGRMYISPDEIYGRSPAIFNLPEIRMLNKMAKTFIMSSEMATVPPLQVEEGSVPMQPVIEPGGIIYRNIGSAPIEPLNTGINPQLTDIALQRQEQKIKDAFYNNMFQALADYRNMTATEVVGRREEALTMLSPLISALQKELFDPLLFRALQLAMEGNRIPEPPGRIPMDIKYRGRLAMAMSKTQSDAVLAHLANWSPYLQVKPDLLDNIDLDATFKDTAMSNGVKTELIASDDDRDETRAVREQQQQMAQQAQMAEMGSKALLNTAKAQEAGFAL